MSPCDFSRERLQGIEGEFPGASWLPVIFQTLNRMAIAAEIFAPLGRRALDLDLCFSGDTTE
jgi:hypothetical protein